MPATGPFYPCSLALAADLVGGKWKMVILWHLRKGVARFGELRRLLPGISQKMLAQQLRELEQAGLVARTVYPVVPPKVEYRLADDGRSLTPVLEQFCGWSRDYARARGIRTGSDDARDAEGCLRAAGADAAMALPPND